MTSFADILDSLAKIGEVVTAFSICFLALQFVNDTRVRRLKSLEYIEFLSQERYADARFWVRTVLFAKPYSEWDADDKSKANSVCSSYDQLGILVSAKMIDDKSTQILLKSSWGESICDQYEALRDYLDDRQTPHKTGREFFKYFGILYAIARRHHRKSKSQHK